MVIHFEGAEESSSEGSVRKSVDAQALIELTPSWQRHDRPVGGWSSVAFIVESFGAARRLRLEVRDLQLSSIWIPKEDGKQGRPKLGYLSGRRSPRHQAIADFEELLL